MRQVYNYQNSEFLKPKQTPSGMGPISFIAEGSPLAELSATIKKVNASTCSGVLGGEGDRGDEPGDRAL